MEAPDTTAICQSLKLLLELSEHVAAGIVTFVPPIAFSITETHAQIFLNIMITQKYLMLLIPARWVSYLEFENEILQISAGLISASIFVYYCISEASVDFVLNW